MRDGLPKDSGPLCRAVSNAPAVSLCPAASDLGDILEGALFLQALPFKPFIAQSFTLRMITRGLSILIFA
ncbi:hypothetical protein FA13DRAFT_1730265 [Coprinellus micaceus]|uniref:Uncharacterized protein n=1 Tax=Coprinellus micaceus TaxID=71717 RepID=A0A4Y7TIF0_COPMI|nr:hypothetical protein FA13DRAFT_1730265 [Coprinellus micaceus]